MISDKVLYKVRISYFGLRPPLVLAIGVMVGDNWVSFHSTERSHYFGGRLLKETKRGFVWHRIEDTLEEGLKDFGTVEFKALTLEEYNREVRPHVFGPVPEFNSTEELYEFYRRKFIGAG